MIVFQLINIFLAFKGIRMLISASCRAHHWSLPWFGTTNSPVLQGSLKITKQWVWITNLTFYLLSTYLYFRHWVLLDKKLFKYTSVTWNVYKSVFYVLLCILRYTSSAIRTVRLNEHPKSRIWNATVKWDTQSAKYPVS